MRYTVSLEKQPRKFLESLTSDELLRRLRAAIDSLSENPHPQGSVKLQGRPAYRVRVGDYRVIYEINDGVLTVIVVEIGHRREIYR